MEKSDAVTSPELSKLCMDCFECCKTLGILTAYPFEHVYIEFYQTRGLECFPDPITGRLVVYHNIPCPQLTDRGCAIYRDRPMVCRMYNGKTGGGPKPINCKWKQE